MIALIPAKGSSERIPHKNRTMVLGKPVLGWTIEAVRRSNLVDEIFVSTEDSLIADITREFGATVATRPKHLARTDTPLRPVVQHFIDLMGSGKDLDQMLVVLPTAALLRSETIARAAEALSESGLERACAFTCTSYGHPIERSFTIENGSVQSGIRDIRSTHRQTQSYAKHYHDAGVFYLGTKAFFKSDLTVFGLCGIPIVIPSHEGIDVDWPEDLVLLEALLRNKNSNK